MNSKQREQFIAVLREVGNDLIQYAASLESWEKPDWTGSWLGLECQGHISNELRITTAKVGGEFGDSI